MFIFGLFKYQALLYQQLPSREKQYYAGLALPLSVNNVRNEQGPSLTNNMISSTSSKHWTTPGVFSCQQIKNKTEVQ